MTPFLFLLQFAKFMSKDLDLRRVNKIKSVFKQLMKKF